MCKLGGVRALASGPASSQRGGKTRFFFHVPEAAEQGGWAANPFVSSLSRLCREADETREGPEEAEMGAALSSLTAPGTKGRPAEAAPAAPALRWGRAGCGRMRPCPAQLRCQPRCPRAAAEPFCGRRGGPADPVRLLSISEYSPKRETNPQSHQKLRLSNEI